MNFKKWLLSEGSNPGAKTGLYALSYGGIGLYPPQWYLTRSADAVFYLSIDDRIYSSKDNKNMPKAEINYKMNSGESGLWDISKLKGRPSYKKNKPIVPDVREKSPWNITNLK